MSAKESQFVASDGRYFPSFIHRFFSKAKDFETAYPKLSHAKQGMQIIEVRPVNLDQINQNESNLSWSANGAYLSYETIDFQNRHIMLRALGGSFEKRLAMVPKGQPDFLKGLVSQKVMSYNSGLSWANDGKRYAFMSNGGVGIYNIYIGAINGEEQIVAQSTQKDGYAVWSPVRSELVFVSARTGHGDLYLLELGRNKLERLTFSEEPDLFPEWLPDGSGIVYASGASSEHQIMLLKKGHNHGWQEPIALTNWRSDSLRPRISPCGQWLAFYSSQPKRNGSSAGPEIWNLHVIPVNNRTLLESERSQSIVASNVVVDLNTGPAWSPDGQKIFYVKQDPKQFNPIYTYKLQQKKSYMLHTGTKMNRDILMSSLGVLSFRAQVGAWDRIYVALTNQGQQLQVNPGDESKKSSPIATFFRQLHWKANKQNANHEHPNQRIRL